VCVWDITRLIAGASAAAFPGAPDDMRRDCGFRIVTRQRTVEALARDPQQRHEWLVGLALVQARGALGQRRLFARVHSPEKKLHAHSTEMRMGPYDFGGGDVVTGEGRYANRHPTEGDTSLLVDI
jgi:hypothetical protein